MKSTISFFVALFLSLNFGSFCFSQDVPSESTRENNPKKYPKLSLFPGTQEFVRDGVPNEALMNKFLSESVASSIKDMGLKWLEVELATIDSEQIQDLGAAGLLVPVIFSMRYEKNAIISGTVNAYFHVQRLEKSVQVTLVRFSNSNDSQMFGRTLWNINFSHFVDQVAGNTLRYLLNTPGPADLKSLLTVSPR